MAMKKPMTWKSERRLQGAPGMVGTKTGPELHKDNYLLGVVQAKVQEVVFGGPQRCAMPPGESGGQ